MVTDDDAERPALRRAGRRVRAAPRDVAVRDREGERRERQHADPEVVPVPADQQEAADRRADRDAEVRRDPDGCVRGLVPLRRDEVGDHRLVCRAAERAEHRQEREQGQACEHVVPDREQAQRHQGHAAPAEQDHRPPADPVGGVAAEVADEAGEHGPDQVGEGELALGGVQALDRPDPEEREHRRAGNRSDQAHGEDRP